MVEKGGLYNAEDVTTAQCVPSGLVALCVFQTQSSQPHELIGLVFLGRTHGSVLALFWKYDS